MLALFAMLIGLVAPAPPGSVSPGSASHSLRGYPPGIHSTRSAPRPFVALRDVDPTIGQEIRYATSHNFTGAPVPGYREPECILTEPAALALRRAQRALRPKGLSLKVYDCYRPRRAVARFVAWARSPGGQSMKHEFYPRVDKRRLIADGYIADRSAHSRGSTVDLTIASLDMGTGFDFFDPRAHTMNATGAQRRNRLLLRQTMRDAGFTGIDTEWWHFTYRREPFPGTYFDFSVSRSSITGSSAVISRTSSSAFSRAASSAWRPSGVIR
jgi:zinc D-Ala-D-Ala dipeptidase